MATLWRVWYSMGGPEETEPLVKAALHRITVENYAIFARALQDGTETDPEASFNITGTDEEDARQNADTLWGHWRIESGLDPGIGELLVITPSDWLRWDRYLSKAVKLAGPGSYRNEEAVVFAQVACEVQATDVLREAIHASPMPWLNEALMRRSTDLRDKRARLMLAELTGLRIVDEAWWPRYCKHVERRHRIVHEGTPATPAEAAESIAVAGDFCRTLARAVGREDEESS